MIVEAGLRNLELFGDVGVAEAVEPTRLNELFRDLEDPLRRRRRTGGRDGAFLRHYPLLLPTRKYNPTSRKNVRSALRQPCPAPRAWSGARRDRERGSSALA